MGKEEVYKNNSVSGVEKPAANDRKSRTVSQRFGSITNISTARAKKATIFILFDALPIVLLIVTGIIYLVAAAEYSSSKLEDNSSLIGKDYAPEYRDMLYTDSWVNDDTTAPAVEYKMNYRILFLI